MRGRWSFRGKTGGEVVFASAAELAAARQDVFSRVHDSLRALDEVFRGGVHLDDVDRPALLEILDHSGHARFDLARVPTPGLLEMVRLAVEQRAIGVLGAPAKGKPRAAAGGTVSSREVPEPPPPRPPPPRRAPPAERTWIEVEILYDDGTPYAGPCSLELAGGALRSGGLDGNGRLTLTDLVPGTCVLSLPDLDATAQGSA
jgi:hypothetical protein